MIEIENENNRNLKNVKQIGTPREENKIYIENMAYNMIKEDTYRDKSVFVLMGHTERMEGRYATFIEAAIPVRDIEYLGFVPKWNNTIWSEVFHEIKRLYEDMIIVGWSFDAKGMSPKLTPDLERMHREHFGGVHQLLFLLDTMEQEESFYIYKENKIVPKDGFYIYHRVRRKESTSSPMQQEHIPVKVLPEKTKAFRRIEPEVDVDLQVSETEWKRGGRYRELLQEQKKPQKDNGNIGIAVAVAMLVFVIGVGVYENSDSIFGNKSSIETGLFQNQASTEQTEESEQFENTEDKKQDSETGTDFIEIEIVPGNE